MFYMGFKMRLPFQKVEDMMKKLNNGIVIMLLGGVGGMAHAVGTGTLRFEGLILPATCDLSTEDVSRTVTLPSISIGDYPTDRPDTGHRNFDVTAICENGISQVKFTFAGTPAPGHTARFQNTGTATGIDLFLYSRIGGTWDTIYNGAFRNIPVAAGVAVLPLGAAYYNTTGAAPTQAGTFESVVTVTITYS